MSTLVGPSIQSTPLTEVDLMQAYRAMNAPVLRHEPCACGGRISTWKRDPTEAVRAHQRTSDHIAWRERSGL